MGFVVCTINMKLGAESETARLGRSLLSLDNSVPSFCLWRCEDGKGKHGCLEGGQWN